MLLSAAERPLLIAGGGVVGADAAAELRRWRRGSALPVLVTQMGIGALASDDAHLVGQGGVVFGESVLRALREADVVLAAGCRFSSWLWDGMRARPAPTIPTSASSTSTEIPR